MILALGSFATYFVVFCRVGACIMTMPGYSTPHIPIQARLFLALAVSMSITPLVQTIAGRVGDVHAPAVLAVLILAELLAGALMGLLGRIVFSAVQVAGSAMSQLSGFSGLALTDDGSGELSTELGALLSATVLTLLFVLDFHVDVVMALVESYVALPFGILSDPAKALDLLAGAVATAFALAVRIAAPFIVAGVVINFAFGLVNKIAPQVPAIFISAPFVIAAGIYIFHRLGAELALTLAQTTLTFLRQ